MDDIRQEYFEWIYGIICSGKKESYYYLLDQMFNTPFQYSHPMDSNRVADAQGLRYIWGRECGYADSIIAATLDIYECSVLEILVALAARCEEQIMYDSAYGDRTAEWIWVMLHNLDLDDMDDEHYHDEAIAHALDKFMDREYNPDGSNGGLFVLKNPRADLRETEIWYQAMWYLTEQLKEAD